MNTRLVAFVIILSAGCGRLAEHETESVVGPEGKHDGAPKDAKDAATEEDGPSQPVVVTPVTPACDTSACPMQSSICVDDSTMRWFATSCGDAGTCEYTPYDMKCDKAPIQPDCFQGGCRLVIVR